jgi:uroporphyrinogen-III synthase
VRLLVTRPQEDAERTAALLEARGHEAIIAPLLEIRTRPGPTLELAGVQAVLVTSANGVRALADRTGRRDLPVYAVGPQSAAAARRTGFASVRSANGDAAALAEAVRQWAKPEEGALFHAAGAQTKGDLTERLRSAGFKIESEVLYEAIAATHLPPQASAALHRGDLDAVLLYSPRSARTFADLVLHAGLKPTCAGIEALCISAATASALGGLPFRSIRHARRPSEEGMLALLG